MASSAMLSRVENEKVLVLERVFDAPRELVYKMFSEAEHLKHWWGPRGWELPVCNIDFRPGGVWHYCMKCVNESLGEYYGMEAWGKAVYKVIEAPAKLDYTDYFSDAEGGTNPDLPVTEVETDFIDEGGKTKIVSRSSYVTPEALRTVMDMGMLQGITETWDRMEERLNELK